MIEERFLKKLRVKPGTHVRLKSHDTGWAMLPELKAAGKEKVKARAQAALAASLERLSASAGAALRRRSLRRAHRPPGDGRRGQGRHDPPRDVRRQPAGLPGLQLQAALGRGARSHFPLALPEVRCPSVAASASSTAPTTRTCWSSASTPSLLEARRLAKEKIGKKFWAQRFDDINNFERHLVRNGTIVLKFFLNISKDEQKRRFLDRLDDPEKHWKFSPADLAERAHWDRYQ